MEPTVRELVERVEREVVEGEELLHAREVEEAVAADVPGDVPEEQAEHRSRREDPPPARDEELVVIQHKLGPPAPDRR
jgi:hypothetical protein